MLDRLFNPRHAFDQPAAAWFTVGLAAVLILAPLVIAALAAGGLVTPEHRARLFRIYKSWLILVPAMLVPILAGPAYTILAVTALSLLCYREFARATGLFRDHLVSGVVILGILALAFAVADHWYNLFVAIPPLALAIMAAAAILPDQPKGYIQRVGLGGFGFLFFGASLLHLAYFANDPYYRPILILLILCVEANDIFAYICGNALGRRRLAPNTSPNKTVGGALGAMVLTTALAAILGHYVFRADPDGTGMDHPLTLIALGLLISVGGQFGDLMLSSVKRDLGIKDFSSFIPGHGGFLDRFDSLILVAPAAFHFIGYFRGVGALEPTRIFSLLP